MDKQQDVLVILKLYELRRDEKMRAARSWYFTEFSPTSAMEIINLYRNGADASAKFRMVVSYWDMAASFVINRAIDKDVFLKANTEHIFVYAKIEPYLNEVREIFREPDFFINLEKLCKKMPDYEQKLEGRKRLSELWKVEKQI